MRFLLTGAAGFIGSHLCDALTARGHETLCVGRNPARPGFLDGRHASELMPWDDLEACLSDTDPFDYVIHAAGATRAFDYHGYLAGNVTPTRRLLEMLVRTRAGRRLRRFVLVSSQAAAGPSPDGVSPVLESDAPAPVSPYGRSKLEAERVAKRFGNQLSVTIVRPPAVFGPRDKDTLGVFRAAQWRFAPYITGAALLVSVVYVKDLVQAIIHAGESDSAAGETFFLANQAPEVWKDFCVSAGLALARRCIPLPIPLGVVKVMGKAGDVVGRLRNTPTLMRSDKFEEMRRKGWVCSSEKAQRLLGWKAETPLMGALIETAQWYQDQGWL